MAKWRVLLDSARQIGPETTLDGILIPGVNGIAAAEEVQAEFFPLRILKMF